jgi:hypothetical protein
MGASPQTPRPRYARLPAVLRPHVIFTGSYSRCKITVYSFTVCVPKALRPEKDVPGRVRPVNSIRICILRILFIRNLYARVRQLLEELSQSTGTTGRTGSSTAVTTDARRTGRHASYGLLVRVRLNQALCTYRGGDGGWESGTNGPID